MQDSWSVLEHKISYKKSIPPSLKRRINTLAALFELADHEFRNIREATEAEITKAQTEDSTADDEQVYEPIASSDDIEGRQFAPLNAFRLLRIAHHFFPDYEFEPQKVDGFTQQVIEAESAISRGKFNYYMRENIAQVRRYRAHFMEKGMGDQFNPYTEMRHCLYRANAQLFAPMLTSTARENFDTWLQTDEPPDAKTLPARRARQGRSDRRT